VFDHEIALLLNLTEVFIVLSKGFLLLLEFLTLFEVPLALFLDVARLDSNALLQSGDLVLGIPILNLVVLIGPLLALDGVFKLDL